MKIKFKTPNLIFLLSAVLSFVILLSSFLLLGLKSQEISFFKNLVSYQKIHEANLKRYISEIENQLNFLKSQNQYLINKNLSQEIENIQKTYKKLVFLYEDLIDFKGPSKSTEKLDKLLAESINLLAERKYASAEAKLQLLEKKLKEERKNLTATFKIPENIPIVNAPSTAGYHRQKVQTDIGVFLVDIISADLNNTRVIVDTASESDCFNDCPVLSLSQYASRNGAFAGINGSYFCPASYPTCVNKKNSFDTLLMNKNKKYFNSGNNIYSTVPAAIFSGNSSRFVAQSLEWGRDTGVDAVIANHPLLVFNNQIAVSNIGNSKQINKGNRSFIGTSGDTVFIGVVHNASVSESAKVLYTLGLTNALNLDDGGSTALWYSGYKVGPGRDIPNAVLLLKK